MPTTLSNGSITLSREEHELVLELVELAKTLALDMDADDNRDDDRLVEVRLLRLVERVEAMWS